MCRFVPSAETFFGAMLEETSAVFQGDILYREYTAELREFGGGNAEEFRDG